MGSQTAGLSSTTAIANAIRRSGRFEEIGAGYRGRIEQLRREERSEGQVYQAGLAEGRLAAVENLADVLWAVQHAGLGRAAVAEESNSHVVLRVHECICQRTGSTYGCRFVAGFLAGALLATGRWRDLEVRELACAEYPGQTCTFRASIRTHA